MSVSTRLVLVTASALGGYAATAPPTAVRGEPLVARGRAAGAAAESHATG